LRGVAAEPRTVGAAVRRDRREVRVYDVARALQVDLQIGHCGVAQGDPDLVGLQLLNAVLAGGPLGRLTRTLRQRGIAYFVHSHFVARRGPGPFFIATAVRPDQAARAVAAALDELRRLHDEPIPTAELATARRWLEGAMYRSFEVPGDVADRLTHLEAFDLPDDHYTTALAEMSELDAAALLAIAHRRLDPERLAIVAAGPARSLAGPLAAFGDLLEERPASLDGNGTKASSESSFGTAGGDPPSFPNLEERR
jgi:predicted Zn-dependent peptidase